MKNLALITLFLLFAPQGIFSQKTEFTAKDALNVKSFSITGISDNGETIFGTIRTRKDGLNVDHGRYGDPNYVSPSTSSLIQINTATGEQKIVLPENTRLGGASLSPDGSDLAYLVYETGKFNLYIYNIARSKARSVKLKSELMISSNSELEWTPDGKNLIISLRSKDWSVKGDSLFKEATIGPITVYDSKRPFLKWDEIRNHSSLNIIALLDINSGTVKELLPEGRYSNLTLPEKENKLLFVETLPKKTTYERGGGAEYGLYSINLNNPAIRDTLQKNSEKRVSINWNSLNDTYAYVDSNRIYIRSINLSEPLRISSDTMELVKEKKTKAKFSFVRWSPDDKSLLASSANGYWIIDIGSKEMKQVYLFPEDKDKAPDLNIIHWSNDGKTWFMTYSAKDKWERGIVKYSIESQSFTDLIKDTNLYSRWQVSEDGSKFFYNFSDGSNPDELFVADQGFSKPVQITKLNPWINSKKIPRSELVKYMDSDGKELFGVLYYPVDYEEGKKYPLVCEIYENFFNNGYSYSMNLITNAGYFGFKPSVNLIEGYPGEAWIKGITSGINKLIEQGMVDADKLGVHGTSYGGYATSLLITQTDRFAAAINISGKTDIISFLGDSPRIGTRNYSAAENGQDRIGESLWDAPMKYFATSALMSADRINTPHLLLTGEGDWNVPAINSRELYYAMRRLGKEAVWVNYYNGGHGAGNASNEADFYDHWNRILDWYQTHFEKEGKK